MKHRSLPLVWLATGLLFPACGDSSKESRASRHNDQEETAPAKPARSATSMIDTELMSAAEFKAFEEKVHSLLKQGENLVRSRINTLADAKKAGIQIHCTEEDALILLKIIVDPKLKRRDGMLLLGPEGKVADVAMNGVVLLCIAAEQDTKLAQHIFKTLEEECNAESFPPALFHFIIVRLADTDIKGINEYMKSLAKAVNAKSTTKGSDRKWIRKSTFISNVWASIGMRATKSDLPDIIQAFNDDSCDDKVAQTLCIVFRNIITYSIKGKGQGADKERAECGDQLFEGIPDKWRTNSYVMKSIAASGSTKAFEFFKKHAEDPANWKGDVNFFGYYNGPGLLPFLLELKTKAGDDAKKQYMLGKCFETMLAQNIDRTEEELQQLLELTFGDDLKADTSQLMDYYAKTEPDSVECLPDGPEKERCMAELKRLKTCQRKKLQLITTLGGMEKLNWVVKTLNDFAKDPDREVSEAAGRALKRLEQNARKKAEQQAAYDAKLQN